MGKKVGFILLLIIAAIIGVGSYFYLNGGNTSNNQVSEKPKVKLVIKTPVLQMESIVDEEIDDAYGLMQKVAKKFEEQYTEADVDVEVIQFEKSEEDDQIVGCYGKDNAADILFEEYFNMSTYVHTGKVVPLDDIISTSIRNDIDENFWEISSLNGKTYMMPFLGMQNTLCYNKDMFRKAGLEKYISDEDVIQNWTLEEWDEILAALQNNLTDEQYTMMMYAKNQMGDTHVMTLLRSRGCEFFDENGRVKLTTPEGIEAVQWLMDCNEKGYFPTNAENIEINDCYDLFMNGQIGLYINNAVLNVSIKESGVDYGFVNFPSKEGYGFCTSFLTGFEVFDNDVEEKLKVAKDFVKFVYENDDMLAYSAGSIPCSNRISEKYKDQLQDLQKWIDNTPNGWNFTGNAPNWRGVRNIFYQDIKELLYGEKTAEEIAKLIEDDCNKAIEEGYENSVLHE